MRLIAIDYQQRRLDFFKAQLKSAKRKLAYSIKHNPDWYDNEEKAEAVSFYEWAVKMAEESLGKKTSDGKQATSGWIGVEERLPENERERVLVLLDSEKLKKLIGEPEMDTDRIVDGRWVRWNGMVTHWMPLPPAPEVEG